MRFSGAWVLHFPKGKKLNKSKTTYLPSALPFFIHCNDYLCSSNNRLKKMAIRITDECINCGACEPECPNTAIYEGGVEWAIADGTSVSGNYTLEGNKEVDAGDRQGPVEDDYYFIVPEKCTECVGFHDEPQCAAVCPVDCCVPDEERVESETILLDRKAKLHL